MTDTNSTKWTPQVTRAIKLSWATLRDALRVAVHCTKSEMMSPLITFYISHGGTRLAVSGTNRYVLALAKIDALSAADDGPADSFTLTCEQIRLVLQLNRAAKGEMWLTTNSDGLVKFSREETLTRDESELVLHAGGRRPLVDCRTSYLTTAVAGTVVERIETHALGIETHAVLLDIARDISARSMSMTVRSTDKSSTQLVHVVYNNSSGMRARLHSFDLYVVTTLSRAETLEPMQIDWPAWAAGPATEA